MGGIWRHRRLAILQPDFAKPHIRNIDLSVFLVGPLHARRHGCKAIHLMMSGAVIVS